ncbi:MAG: 4-(cytidine 5'-diphospho)-2-C-methyl-D-erythritol kinase [Candidatus Limnocylindrales bacterium]
MTLTGGSGARIHVVRFAPGKLNLTLAVVRRRRDGYHDLHSVMVPLSLGDALTVSPAPSGSVSDSLRVTGLPIPPAEDNLVLRAIVATRAELAAAHPGAPTFAQFLAARLAKRVPVAAGLGGGSSDAAAAIEAALAAWGAELDPTAIAALAASLGSDVPFFLARGAALVTGRGEFVEPLRDIGGEPPAVLLVTPLLPLATAEVFKAYAGGARQADPGLARDTSERLAAEMRAGLTAERLLAVAEELASANDLLAAAASLAPGLHGFIDTLERLVGRPVCQSGSGPTLWSLYTSLAEARKAGRFVRLAAVNGALPLLGAGEPFIAATTIAGRALPPQPRPSDGSTDTIRPRTVHNASGADRQPRGGPSADPGETKGEDPR